MRNEEGLHTTQLTAVRDKLPGFCDSIDFSSTKPRLHAIFLLSIRLGEIFSSQREPPKNLGSAEFEFLKSHYPRPTETSEYGKNQTQVLRMKGIAAIVESIENFNFSSAEVTRALRLIEHAKWYLQLCIWLTSSGNEDNAAPHSISFTRDRACGQTTNDLFEILQFPPSKLAEGILAPRLTEEGGFVVDVKKSDSDQPTNSYLIAHSDGKLLRPPDARTIFLPKKNLSEGESLLRLLFGYGPVDLLVATGERKISRTSSYSGVKLIDVAGADGPIQCMVSVPPEEIYKGTHLCPRVRESELCQGERIIHLVDSKSKREVASVEVLVKKNQGQPSEKQGYTILFQPEWDPCFMQGEVTGCVIQGSKAALSYLRNPGKFIRPPRLPRVLVGVEAQYRDGSGSHTRQIRFCGDHTIGFGYPYDFSDPCFRNIDGRTLLSFQTPGADRYLEPPILLVGVTKNGEAIEMDVSTQWRPSTHEELALPSTVQAFNDLLEDPEECHAIFERGIDMSPRIVLNYLTGYLPGITNNFRKYGGKVRCLGYYKQLAHEMKLQSLAQDWHGIEYVLTMASSDIDCSKTLAEVSRMYPLELGSTIQSLLASTIPETRERIQRFLNSSLGMHTQVAITKRGVAPFRPYDDSLPQLMRVPISKKSREHLGPASFRERVEGQIPQVAPSKNALARMQADFEAIAANDAFFWSKDALNKAIKHFVASARSSDEVKALLEEEVNNLKKEAENNKGKLIAAEQRDSSVNRKLELIVMTSLHLQDPPGPIYMSSLFTLLASLSKISQGNLGSFVRVLERRLRDARGM